MYAFSHNADGSADKTATIYPAIAWWGGRASLPHADTMFERWASDEFSTDWGMRDVGEHEAVYDPISYHQGSVWPLFTGWASLAEYRSGRALAGYTHLMQNANLTTAQDLGAVTELLSGAYFDPFGRSTSHQMWSSAMVLVPAIRGLFGVSIDAINGVVTVDPHLPAQWPAATLHNVQVGKESVDLKFARSGSLLHVVLLPKQASSRIKLASGATDAKISTGGRELSIPLPAVEVGMGYGADEALPLPGSATEAMKVLGEEQKPHQLVLTLEAQGGSMQELYVRSNAEKLRVTADGATLRGTTLSVKFPEGSGYQRTTVTLHW
jgi:hypothetical protein